MSRHETQRLRRELAQVRKELQTTRALVLDEARATCIMLAELAEKRRKMDYVILETLERLFGVPDQPAPEPVKDTRPPHGCPRRPRGGKVVRRPVRRRRGDAA